MCDAAKERWEKYVEHHKVSFGESLEFGRALTECYEGEAFFHLVSLHWRLLLLFIAIAILCLIVSCVWECRSARKRGTSALGIDEEGANILVTKERDKADCPEDAPSSYGTFAPGEKLPRR